MVVCVVEEKDQLHTAIEKFLAQRFKKNTEPVLFIYNIGSEQFDGMEFARIIPVPKVLCIFNCDSDLLTLKVYGKDYQAATADATVIATQLAGVECDDFRFYNFFEPPKRGRHVDHEKAIQILNDANEKESAS